MFLTKTYFSKNMGVGVRGNRSYKKRFHIGKVDVQRELDVPSCTQSHFIEMETSWQDDTAATNVGN